MKKKDQNSKLTLAQPPKMLNPRGGVVAGVAPEELEASLEFLRKNPMTPKQQAVADLVGAQVAAAGKAIDEIFSGGFNEENIDFIKALAKAEHTSYEIIAERISAIKPGGYFIGFGRAYFMTGDQKIQEASAYVHRLEKNLIAAFNRPVAPVAVPGLSWISRWKKFWSDWISEFLAS